MAPKVRPAATPVKQGTKRRAVVLKRPAAAPSSSPGSRRITASQCQSVVAALEGADELPQKVRDMLATLVGQNLSDSWHPYQEAAMAVVGEALADIETRLRSELAEAKAVFEKDASKSAREEAVRQARAYLSEQQQKIEQLKPAIKEAAQAMKTKREELQNAKAAHKILQSERNGLEAKMLQLQTAEKDVYQPLKDAPASGRDGQKKVEVLQKVGKDFGFHDVLMDVLPVVLKKQPNRRRTFDGAAMQHFEREVSKQSAKLGAALQEREACIEETSEAMQSIGVAVDQEKSEHASNTRALAQAKENLISGRSALLEAQRRVRMFDSDMRKCVRDLEDKAAKLKAFQQGPLASFRKLSKQAPIEVPTHAAEDLASDEDEDMNATGAMSADEEEDLHDQDMDPKAMEAKPVQEDIVADEDEDSNAVKTNPAEAEGTTDEDEDSDHMNAEPVAEETIRDQQVNPDVMEAEAVQKRVLISNVAFATCAAAKGANSDIQLRSLTFP